VDPWIARLDNHIQHFGGATMRRHDREVTDRDGILSILDASDVCRIALQTDNAPYVVPLNFGYEWAHKLELFFHSASTGRKLELIRQNPYVGFEIDVGHDLVRSSKPCGWGMNYRSVVGAGLIRIVEKPAEKERALDAIMKHYGYIGKPAYEPKTLEKTVVYKLIVEELSAKQKP